MNIIDIFLGIVQTIIAFMFIFSLDLHILPEFVRYTIAGLLIISGIWDIFD